MGNMVIDLDELREWVQENRAGLGTEVRVDESNSLWQPWQYYPELVALLAEVRCRGPATGVPSGLIVASFGRRTLAYCPASLILILIQILTAPLVFVVMKISGIADWQDQVVRMFLQPDIPVAPELLYYLRITNLMWYVITTLYMAGFLSAHGKTPAKAMLRLQVVSDGRGQEPSRQLKLLRGIVFAISISLWAAHVLRLFQSATPRAA